MTTSPFTASPIPVSPPADGASLGSTQQPPNIVFIITDQASHGIGPMIIVRDNRWKVVEFIDSDQGQLFDVDADPMHSSGRKCIQGKAK